ncbi:27 kDa hemolymph protein-like [Leguminivora glycinivorella]|uniref:27 kDa hemolymph protein-like n=1 Tax=Leguminivora glycinivorella TaxID=1035111 RepID=UPI00200BA612|nr:27 kDa hemolymph protein-like [Leguminivora glycinivorella]
MLWRLICVATLAVGVFGRTTFTDYDPYEEYSTLLATEYCKASHAEQHIPEVKSTITKFGLCLIGLVDTETVGAEFEAAKTSGSYDTIIKKYCAKAPQLKECTHALVEGMTPCLPAETPATAMRSSIAMIDFICENDGARVTTFVKEGGAQCVKEKQLGMAFCQEAMKTNVTKLTEIYGGGVAGSLAISDKEKCTVTDQGLTCLVDVLKGCSNPVPGRLGQEFHDVYLESMSCSKIAQEHEVVKVDTVQTASAPVLSDTLEQLQKKKLELEVRIAELEMWNMENKLNVQHTVLTSDIKKN